MIRIDIPGRGAIELAHAVFDYNGTIAVDGIIPKDVACRLHELAGLLGVRVLTADTFGTAAAQCGGIGIAVETFPTDVAAPSKRAVVESLSGGVVCFGNGVNDGEMFRAADLAIGIMGVEGMSPTLFGCSDVVVGSPADAIDLLLKPDRLKATLRH